MLYLLKKELTANIRYTLISLFIFIALIFSISTNSSFLFMMCLFISYFFLMKTNLSIDERYKIDLLLLTLPVRRKDIVLSKYLLMLVIYIGGIILYTACAIGGRALGYDNIPMLNLLGASFGLFIISIFNGLILPLTYKFGAQSMRFVSFILYFAGFILGSFLVKHDVSILNGFVNTLNADQISFLLFAAAVFTNIFSYMIAKAIYENKDF